MYTVIIRLGIAFLFFASTIFAAHAENKILYQEDFEWLEPWSSQKPAGDTVGENNSDATAQQLGTNKVDGISTYDALIEKGYEFPITHHPSKSPREPKAQVYLQRNYLKLGLTGYYSGITLPKFDVPENVQTKISFSWTPQRQLSGKFDETKLVVVVTDGANTTILDVPEHNLNDGEDYRWIQSSVGLGNILSTNCRITIRNADNQWPAGGETVPPLRFHLDNIVVSSMEEIFEVKLIDPISEIPLGNSAQFSAQIVYNASESVREMSRSWISSNEDVGTIDENGLFHAIQPGKTTITINVLGTDGNTYSDTAEITVTKLQCGDSFVLGEFSYKVLSTDPSTVEIGPFTGSAEHYDIPASVSIDNVVYSVVKLFRTFENHNELKSVSIPSSVIEIGESAFSYTSIDNVKLPESLRTISSHAFSGCGFSSIDIPSTVDSIGDGAFSRSALHSFTVPPLVNSISSDLFEGCTSLSEIKMHDRISYIGPSAFALSALQTFTFPPLVNTISPRLFESCTTLSEIKMHEGISEIGDWAFYRCSNLLSVEIPKTVTKIGERAFYGCSNFTSIDIPNSVIEIGYRAFSFCSNIVSVYIPESVTTIGNRAFCDCSNLSSVKISDNVTTIGDFAFASCPSLSNIILPTSLSTISKYTFSDCTALSNIQLPPGISTIGDKAFNNCTALSEISLPQTLKEIGSSAFNNCTALSAILLPQTLKAIGSSAFNGTNLSSVYIPSSVQSIGLNSSTDEILNPFSNCTNLKTIDVDPQNEWYTSVDGVLYSKDMKNLIAYPCSVAEDYTTPLTVSKIVTNAFSGSNVININLHDNVSYFGYQKNLPALETFAQPRYCTIFGGLEFCPNLTAFSLSDNIEAIYFTLKDCPKITELHIPESVVFISNAFHNLTGLKTLYIGSKIKWIHGSSFDGSNSLRKIYVSAVEPPFIEVNAFTKWWDDGESSSDWRPEVKVYVPIGYANDYRTSYWGLVFQDFEETDYNGVENIEVENGSHEDIIFDLNGRRVFNTIPGRVYIVNGKKTLLFR